MRKNIWDKKISSALSFSLIETTAQELTIVWKQIVYG